MESTFRTCVEFSRVATLVAIVLPSTLFAQAVGETTGTTSVLTRMPWPIQLLALDFSNDGSLLVTGGDAVRVHDVATGKMLQEFKVPEKVRSIACSPASRELFAVGRNDGVIGLYRIGADEPIRELPGDGQMVLDLAFSPDGTQLVCSGTKYSADRKARGDVRLWDVDSGTLLHSLEFPDFGISCFAYSADGQHLAIARNPKDGAPKSTAIAELYDVREWRLVRSIPFEPGYGFGLDFTPDGGKLLIAGGVCVPLKPGSCQPTGKIWVVDLADDQPARRIDADPHSYFRTARIAPAGDLFATGTAEVRIRPNEQALVSVIQVRRLDTGELVWSRDGEVGDPNGVAVSPDGDLVAGCTDRQLQIFKASNGELVTTIDIDEAQ